jgi:anti-anti-sigma regulatory factor
VPCRIQVLQDADRRTVSVAGRLEQVHVPDLICACTTIVGPVVLDLSDLLSADSIALDALHRLRAEGVELIGLPQYLGFCPNDID